MAKNFFVTGTDTDAGKTFTSVALLKLAQQQGLRTLGLKPVAAGAELIDGVLKNDDALQLQTASSVQLPYNQINPIIFEEPIAPHIAAQNAGRTVGVAQLAGFVRGALMQPADFRLIEGAGGWLVPLNPQEMLSGVAKVLELDVILVVGIKLGCINHALLTARAIRQDGLKLAGWVANCIDPEMAQQQENIDTLKRMLPAPCLGALPFAETGEADLSALELPLAG
ncbi:ATP-dependent dethiobiotin synthetase BioD 1 [BD1-7 clade bacterium]|uniref:ATP-dependent dethiobiotin synthetase BioD n=1 Tax=BD1-7 clade bacterium TaxID=2029982 RepID=A0A5S9Q9X8_9GAMM|nr:ATP-dependent dethiobiotin synthetase BioD 1 [BD1-7 clade bacterium]CAA0114216.1 ATP-dependent dethiobiotin synthetase BioD 1 [BD1-7 clade bacterium]